MQTNKSDAREKRQQANEEAEKKTYKDSDRRRLRCIAVTTTTSTYLADALKGCKVTTGVQDDVDANNGAS